MGFFFIGGRAKFVWALLVVLWLLLCGPLLVWVGLLLQWDEQTVIIASGEELVIGTGGVRVRVRVILRSRTVRRRRGGVRSYLKRVIRIGRRARTRRDSLVTRTVRRRRGSVRSHLKSVIRTRRRTRARASRDGLGTGSSRRRRERRGGVRSHLERVIIGTGRERSSRGTSSEDRVRVGRHRDGRRALLERGELSRARTIW
jgi:hypothetical protein